MRRKVVGLSVLLVFWGVVYGLRLPEGTDAMVKNVTTYKSGKIASVILIRPTELNTPVGALVFEGEVRFYENGLIKEGTIGYATDRDYGWNSITLKALFEGSSNTFTCSPRRKILFYPTGVIKEMEFEEEEIVTPVGKVPADKLTFYESGKVHSLRIYSYEEREREVLLL